MMQECPDLESLRGYLTGGYAFCGADADEIVATMKKVKDLELQKDAFEKEVIGYRKLLWVLAKQNGGDLMIHQASLIKMPDDAELLSWFDPVVNATMIRANDPENRLIAEKRLVPCDHGELMVIHKCADCGEEVKFV